MNKTKSYVLLFALVSILAVSAISCQKAPVETDEDVSGRPTMSDEKKAEIENDIREVDAMYDVNAITGVYDALENGSTVRKISFFAAGTTGAMADTVYGVWGNSTDGGIIEGAVTKDGKLAGEWKTMDGKYGKVVFVFKAGEDGVMTFAGTYGTGVSLANGGTWTGTETANSSLAKDELAELRAQYQAMEDAADEGSDEEEETPETEEVVVTE